MCSSNVIIHFLFRLINSHIGQVLDTRELCLIGSCNQGEVGVSPRLVSEPYTTEDLSNVRNGVTFLTPPTTAFHFDFSNPEAS